MTARCNIALCGRVGVDVVQNSTGSHHENRLLAALPGDVLARMGHELRQISLEQGRPILRARRPD